MLLRVRACAVCRTDLHIVDGELPEPKLPLVPGHQIVGEVLGGGSRFEPVTGSASPGSAGRTASAATAPPDTRTSATRRASRATTSTAGTRSLPSPTSATAFRFRTHTRDSQAAPLLCAGLIGYRSLRLAGDDVEALGLYGFGASAHIVCQVAVAQGRRVYAGTRANDEQAQELARSLGAAWAGDALTGPPDELDAVIVFAPVGELVPAALGHVRKGGAVVCAGIHMSDIPSFRYELLWGERVVRSVANLTRRDGEEFLALAPRVPVRAEVETFELEQANEALDRLRRGEVRGSAVLVALEENRPSSTRPPGSPAWSTWSVVCSIPNSSWRSRSSSRRRAWQSSPSRTRTCADSAGKPVVIVQMWRSCTSTTPGAAASRSPTRARVDAARRGFEQDRGRVAQDRPRAGEHEEADEHADDRVGLVPAGREDDERRDHHAERAGEVGEHVPEGGLDVEAPPARARERIAPAATFTPMPTSAIASTQPPSTSVGSWSRRIAA